MKRVRALLVALALTVAVPVAVRAAAYACNEPLCALVGGDVWNPLYWLFGCDQCAPNPPDAGYARP